MAALPPFATCSTPEVGAIPAAPALLSYYRGVLKRVFINGFRRNPRKGQFCGWVTRQSQQPRRSGTAAPSGA